MISNYLRESRIEWFTLERFQNSLNKMVGPTITSKHQAMYILALDKTTPE